MKAILDYGWPGNVRELESVLTSCAVWVEGAVIKGLDIGKNIHSEGIEKDGNGFDIDVEAIENLTEFCEDLEKKKLLSLRTQKLTKKEASAKLGYSDDNQTLTKRLKKHNIKWK